MNRTPTILGIPLKIPLIDLRSIALGGGSVVRVEKGSIKLGPESQGAYPGPACYGLGGDKATLTDAFLLCGYLNPDYFAGGTRKLDIQEARSVIKLIADELGCDESEAAFRIAKEAYKMIADEIKSLNISTDSLFAFGGNGGLFGCPIAELVGVKKVYFFSLSSVFSAFGSAVADVIHTYEYSPLESLEAIDAGLVEEMKEEAIRDMEGERLDPTKINLKLELEFEDGEFIETPYQNINELRRNLTKKERVEILRLKAIYETPKPTLPKHTKVDEDPKDALKGDREIILDRNFVQANIYDWDRLKPGNVVYGPAILESTDTTFLLPEKWKLTIDEYLNGKLEVLR